MKNSNKKLPWWSKDLTWQLAIAAVLLLFLFIGLKSRQVRAKQVWDLYNTELSIDSNFNSETLSPESADIFGSSIMKIEKPNDTKFDDNITIETVYHKGRVYDIFRRKGYSQFEVVRVE